MKNRIDNILLGLLWLLSVALGASFWFNTKYGFNIFSAAHWQYLGYMQAQQTPVRPSFYISVTVAILVMLGGLYILALPGLRRMHRVRRTAATQPVAKPTQQSDTTKKIATEIKTPDQKSENSDTATSPVKPVTQLTRPPRLNIARPTTMTAPPQSSSSQPAQPQLRQPTQQSDNQEIFAEIQKIFTDAGYVIKPNPRINGVQIALAAIGINEVLWIGATNVATSQMAAITDKLQDMFLDLLDDIEIDINAFVLNPTDSESPESSDIMTFDTMDQLREYISQHPTVPADDATDFDAYSSFITTVLNFMGDKH